MRLEIINEQIFTLLENGLVNEGRPSKDGIYEKP